MLVLSRKKSETVLIGDSIRVTVIYSGRSKCSLGIQAPEDVKVLREEVRDREQEQSRGVLPRTPVDPNSTPRNRRV